MKKSYRVFIFDCEYFYKARKLPNFRAMKLSSYHKQLGHDVILLREKSDLTNNFDTLYLIKEMPNTKFPPSKYFDNPKAKLIGDGFENFTGHEELSLIIAAVRPDYHLYSYDKPNEITRANFIQFYAQNKRIPISQDYHNTFKGSKVNIYVDNIWRYKKEIIIETLEKLKGFTKILFLYPIPYKRLIDADIRKSFSQLKLHGKNKYRNNVGLDFESIKQIIDVLRAIKDNNQTVRLPPPRIKVITKDHADKDEAMKDFERCLKIMDYAKQKRIRINMVYPKIKITPFHYYFKFFKRFSNHLFRYSYVEAMAYDRYEKFDKTIVWWQLLDEPDKWNNNLKILNYLMNKYPNLIDKYGYRNWGNKMTISRRR